MKMQEKKRMVTIYGSGECTFCKEAKKLCEKYSIPHEYKDTTYKTNLEELKSLRGDDIDRCPYIYEGTEYIGSYQDLLYEAKILLRWVR